MVARLVSDALWRSRWIYVFGGVALIPCWLMYAAGGASFLEIDATALSLIFAAFLGPTFGILTMGLRALRHLPVTNRDLWRTTWVVATVVTAGGLLATKAISVLLVLVFGGSPRVSADTMLLSAVYDFAWAGAILPVVPGLVFAGPAGHPRGLLSPWVAEAGTIVGLLLCIGLPIVVSGVLPAHLGEFTTPTTAALIAGLALAFGALAWTPERGVLAGERVRHAVVLPGASPKLQRRRADRLTGISRVAVPYLVGTVALPVGACLALASYGIISGSGPWWFLSQAPTVFDPADFGDRGLTYFVLLPCAVVTMLSLWAPWARLLRVLPLSVRQINGLLLVTPFAAWTILWLLGLSAYVFAYGTPPSLRVEFAVVMAAIGALVHAALLRFHGSGARVWVLGFCGGLMPQLVKVGLRDGAGPHVLFAVIGAIALVTAAFINHRTLTRSMSSSPAYRQPQPPLGMPAKPIIR